jgi:hypothetical protein
VASNAPPTLKSRLALAGYAAAPCCCCLDSRRGSACAAGGSRTFQAMTLLPRCWQPRSCFRSYSSVQSPRPNSPALSKQSPSRFGARPCRLGAAARQCCRLMQVPHRSAKHLAAVGRRAATQTAAEAHLASLPPEMLRLLCEPAGHTSGRQLPERSRGAETLLGLV